MATPAPLLLTLEDYAKSLGVTPKAIKKAIDTGRIPPSAVTSSGNGGRGGGQRRIFINKTEADPAWAATTNPVMIRSAAAKAAVERIRTESEINGVIAEPSGKETRDNVISLSEAQRREKVAKAHIAQLEFLQRKGTLVLKESVYKQLFEAGRQLRDSIMAVPDMVTAEIAASGSNQSKIRNILTDSLTKSLEGLTDIYKTLE